MENAMLRDTTRVLAQNANISITLSGWPATVAILGVAASITFYAYLCKATGTEEKA